MPASTLGSRLTALEFWFTNPVSSNSVLGGAPRFRHLDRIEREGPNRPGKGGFKMLPLHQAHTRSRRDMGFRRMEGQEAGDPTPPHPERRA